jgi:hypothetical protein
MLLKERLRGRKEEEEDVSSYWMAFKERRRYWKLKEEALDHTLWRTRLGRVNGPVVRQTA